MNEHVYDVLRRARGPRAAELARRLFEGGASVRLVNRLVTDNPYYTLNAGDGALVEAAARLLDLPLPPWTHQERVALLSVYVTRGRAEFDRVLVDAAAREPGAARHEFLDWLAEH